MDYLKYKNLFNCSIYHLNQNYNFSKNYILNIFSNKNLSDAYNNISKWKDYKPTPLIELNKLAKDLKINKIFYKDESKRFHLESFKALGGAYAIEQIAKKNNKIIISTATAGNHGRSVAWGAQRLGMKCKIFISKNVSKTREEEMKKFGAEIIRVDGNYDDSFKKCKEISKKNNWQIVQDISWKNYNDVPILIMSGYSVMIKEIVDQLKNHNPTHVILQAGVGGMAAAAIAGIAAYFKKIPEIIVVESNYAAGLLQSIKNNKPTKLNIKKETIMGGMSCGEISLIAWKVLNKSTKHSVAIPDDAVAFVMTLLSKAKLSDDKIIGGECSTPGIITLLAAHMNFDLKNKLNIKSDSKILVFGCEGATDKQIYEKLIKNGEQII